MSSSDLIEIRRCRALLGGGCATQGPVGPAGPGVSPVIGSFLSNTTQNATIITENVTGNVTEIVAKVTTKQYKAVIGKPVKWVKKVSRHRRRSKT